MTTGARKNYTQTKTWSAEIAACASKYIKQTEWSTSIDKSRRSNNDTDGRQE